MGRLEPLPVVLAFLTGTESTCTASAILSYPFDRRFAMLAASFHV